MNATYPLNDYSSFIRFGMNALLKPEEYWMFLYRSGIEWAFPYDDIE